MILRWFRSRGRCCNHLNFEWRLLRLHSCTPVLCVCVCVCLRTASMYACCWVLELCFRCAQPVPSWSSANVFDFHDWLFLPDCWLLHPEKTIKIKPRLKRGCDSPDQPLTRYWRVTSLCARHVTGVVFAATPLLSFGTVFGLAANWMRLNQRLIAICLIVISTRTYNSRPK